MVGNFAAHLTRDEMAYGAQERGLNWGSIRAPDELVDEGHLNDRGFWVEVPHPELDRSFKYPGPSGIYNGSPWRISRRAPETDIEHIVARSEAHDSGLCAASAATRAKFAPDLLNLTLASPSVNRHEKSDNDVAEWLPDLNQCWYVNRTLQVRREYGLTIDHAEADAADRVLAGCESTDMTVLAPRASGTATATPTRAAPATPRSATEVDALALWDDNGNGRITCAEARAHGIAPVHRGHPAYQYMRDADGDGVVCE